MTTKKFWYSGAAVLGLAALLAAPRHVKRVQISVKRTAAWAFAQAFVMRIQ